MARFATRTISGWGRYPTASCRLYRPERATDLRALVQDRGIPTLIPRGLGRSYGDSSLNPDGVVLNERMNRMMGFDAQSGVLECEAGVSLAEIIQTMLPRGWFLPTTPGTKFVTVGGAIAADVHGKNHHRDGSFGQSVLDLRLLTASGEILVCSPELNPQIFWATLGAMGLTGIVLSARFRLRPVKSAYLNVEYLKTPDLDATLTAFGDDAKYAYSVAWIDCLAGAASLGRSVLMRGDHAEASDVSGDPLSIMPRRSKNIPFNLPRFALNRLSVGAFNAMYYKIHSNQKKIVDFDRFFYPLDSIDNWNRGYGKRGFVQYQAFFPQATSRQGLVELLELLSASGKASFLAVLKSCGPASQGPLSFLRPGHTLALDLPMSPAVPELCAKMDQVLLKHGGRLYLAKDATMSRETFAQMYPELPRFCQIKAQIDPGNRFVSEQARRLGIVA
jgi:decaprenylphospho-beta-D-ribofuranose 2-oxidase